MTKKYEVQIDFRECLIVEINHLLADEIIKEMVEFWNGWEGRLEQERGNYTHTWLKSLAIYFLHSNTLPNNDEGWYPFTDESGIRVIRTESWEILREDMTVVEI